MKNAWDGNEFEALKLRYEDQVELLRSLTNLDFKIFSGFITLQLVLGGWLASHPIEQQIVQIGIFIIDFALGFLACHLLYKQYQRRKEVIQTVKNINEALGFNAPNIYLRDKSINPETKTRPWFLWYAMGLVVALIGLSLILFGGKASTNAQQIGAPDKQKTASR